MLCTYKLWKDRDSDPENPLKLNRMRSHQHSGSAGRPHTGGRQCGERSGVRHRHEESDFLHLTSPRCREFKCTWQILYAF